MIIVLIHWRIKRGEETKFLSFWQTETVIQDRSGMIGEFLSRVEDKHSFPYITWDIGDTSDYFSYINVGFWADEKAFHEQVSKYFDDSRPIKQFESLRRVRTVVQPKEWRVGNSIFPEHDSRGTL